MPQVLEHTATCGLTYMQFAQRNNVSQHAQLECRLWPCIHSKIQTLLTEKSAMCFWYTPQRDYGYQIEGIQSEGPTRERFFLGPFKAHSRHTNRPVRISLFDQFCKKPLFVCFGHSSTYPGNITLFRIFLSWKNLELWNLAYIYIYIHIDIHNIYIYIHIYMYVYMHI